MSFYLEKHFTHKVCEKHSLLMKKKIPIHFITDPNHKNPLSCGKCIQILKRIQSYFFVMNLF